MVKVAICLFGNLGQKSRGSQRSKQIISKNKNVEQSLLEESKQVIGPKKGYEHLHKMIISKYDTDIFLHTWSINYKKDIEELYKPVSAIYETQKRFSCDLSSYGIDIDEHDIQKWKVSDSSKFGYEHVLKARNNYSYFIKEFTLGAFRSSSRWYSTKQSIHLMNQYSKIHNINYDIVLLCRFDSFWNFKPSIPIHKMINNKLFVKGRKGRRDGHISYDDLWFIGPQKLITVFENLYDNRFQYCIRPPVATYEHLRKFISIDDIRIL